MLQNPESFSYPHDRNYSQIHYVTQQRDPETPTKKHRVASFDDVDAADGNEGDDEEVFECADDGRPHRQREPKQVNMIIG